MPTILHKTNEFGKLDWSKLNPGPVGSNNWSIGKGGHGLDDGVWTISVHTDTNKWDMTTDVWVLPAPLQTIFNTLINNARKEVKKEMRLIVENVIDYLGLTDFLGKEDNQAT